MTDHIEWTSAPPPKRSQGRPNQWASLMDECRKKPSKWACVRDVAKTAGQSVTKQPGYETAVRSRVEDGERIYDLYVRYVGGAS